MPRIHNTMSGARVAIEANLPPMSPRTTSTFAFKLHPIFFPKSITSHWSRISRIWDKFSPKRRPPAFSAPNVKYPSHVVFPWVFVVSFPDIDAASSINWSSSARSAVGPLIYQLMASDGQWRKAIRPPEWVERTLSSPPVPHLLLSRAKNKTEFL